MELIGAVVVFLLGAGVGLVLALCLLAARVAQDIATQRANAAEHAELDAALAEEQTS